AAGRADRRLVRHGPVHGRPAVLAGTVEAVQLAQVGWLCGARAVGAALAVPPDAPPAARAARAGLAAARRAGHARRAVPPVLRGAAGGLGLYLGHRLSTGALR